jgi:hypothetical protein
LNLLSADEQLVTLLDSDRQDLNLAPLVVNLVHYAESISWAEPQLPIGAERRRP